MTTLDRHHPCSILLLVLPLAFAQGCGREPAPAQAQDRAGFASDADPEAQKALAEGLTRIVNEQTGRHAPLDYEYDEDLLTRIDQVEAYLAREDPGREVPRFMPKLDESEEVEHFRETIRRWEAARGKKIRPEIDSLRAEVAARRPDGPRFHPEFHKRFSTVFDEFIKYEVAHMQEWRNLAIREKAAPLLEAHRAEHPELVREYEATLEGQYPLPKLLETTGAGEGPRPGASAR